MIIWFGFGIAPKIVLVALFTFFAIAVGTVQGLGSADPDAMNLLRTMGATRAQLLWRVRLPSALPQFFTGLKVSITFAYVAAIFAEYVGATQGLGYYMTLAQHAVNTDLVFGAVIVTALLTLVLFAIVAALERSRPALAPARPGATRHGERARRRAARGARGLEDLRRRRRAAAADARPRRPGRGARASSSR